jgi:hypothetical protein
MADGYAVDRAALAETAQGLNGVIGQLKGLGLSETGDVGRGFSELALSGLQAGNEDVASAFGSFCDRWSWGVRTLVQDGNQTGAQIPGGNMTPQQGLQAVHQQWEGVGQTAMNTPDAKTIKDLLGG